MQKKAVVLSFFIFVFVLMFMPIPSAAEETLTIQTYYPVPEAVYNNADTNRFYSKQTNISSEFRKMSTTPSGDRAIVRASVLPVILADPLNFDFSPNSSSDVEAFIGSPVNTLFDRIYSSEATIDNFHGSAIENLTRIQSGAQTINQWPGLGGECRDIEGVFVVEYTVECDSDEYLVEFSEGFATWIMIGGGVGGGGGGGGFGTGIKSGSWSGKCCKVQG